METDLRYAVTKGIGGAWWLYDRDELHVVRNSHGDVERYDSQSHAQQYADARNRAVGRT
jgi:hypothetical protein